MQMGMLFSQVLEDFDAGGEHRSLPLRNCVFFQPRGIRKIACRPSYGSGEPRIGVDLDMVTLEVSGHGC